MAKRPSRTQERQRLLDRAAAVDVPLYCDVIVIGGGASGLAAAITAAEAGASVTVLERDVECGHTILATGNGRCNFANLELDPTRYNDPEFVASVCGDTWLDDVLGFFHEAGLRWCSEDGRLYPTSLQAASVRNVLLARARDAGVVLAPAREVIDVEFIPEDGSYDWVYDPDNACHYDPHTSKAAPAGLAEVAHRMLYDKQGLVSLPGARTVILATGNTPFPSLDSLGISSAQRKPVLCPIACEESPLSVLDGRRARVLASLTKAGSSKPSWSERGEVLFRSYGLSGIVALNLSRRAEEGDLIELDLAPDLTDDELLRLIGPYGHSPIREGSLDGVIDPMIGRTLELLTHMRWDIDWPRRFSGLTEAHHLVSLVKALPFVVTGPAEIAKAQVIRGGLSNEAFDPQTLSCHAHPWLFACGEALDVDGDCGGFNLAWAWKSGMVAGAAAARWAFS